MSLTYGFCLGEISSLYDSAQFADAFHAVIGDGITPHGYQMAAAVNGFTVTIGTGYAFSAGRWLLNDEPLSLTVNGSGDHDDRTDAGGLPGPQGISGGDFGRRPGQASKRTQVQ